MIKDNIADQLVYSTARIICTNDSKTAMGTGFFMDYEGQQKKIYRALVTNKHVVEGYTAATIKLVGADGNGNPVDTTHLSIILSDLQKHCAYHPDPNIDICFVFINSEINELIAQGNIPYFKSIGDGMFLKSNDYDALTAIEDIIMIGYPNGIIDEINCKPVVRKGITATNLKLDYNGTPVFLIDAACFPGSSGSPIFLRKTGLQKEDTEKGITIGVNESYSLLGILYAGPTLTVDGKIIVKDIPTSAESTVEIKTMVNLGYVVKIQKAVELFEMIDMKNI